MQDNRGLENAMVVDETYAVISSWSSHKVSLVVIEILKQRIRRRLACNAVLVVVMAEPDIMME